MKPRFAPTIRGLLDRAYRALATGRRQLAAIDRSMTSTREHVEESKKLVADSQKILRKPDASGER